MADVTINYEGNAIATMSASGTKTLLTEGKYCTDDIEVVYVSPGGGGSHDDEDAILDGSLAGSYTNDRITTIGKALSGLTLVTSINLQNVTYINVNEGFRGDTSLVTLYIPKVTGIRSNGNYCFGETALIKMALPSYNGSLGNRLFNSCTSLKECDFGPNVSALGGDVWYNCSNFDTLILRRTSIVGIGNTTFSAPRFAADGAGGTIYIPQVLFDHLGDGTSLDYKQATNWSAVEARGTITWAKIEGSAYENYYADGTPV